jgi:hypothetical protein
MVAAIPGRAVSTTTPYGGSTPDSLLLGSIFFQKQQSRGSLKMLPRKMVGLLVIDQESTTNLLQVGSKRILQIVPTEQIHCITSPRIVQPSLHFFTFAF